jgi:threonine aldolase
MDKIDLRSDTVTWPTPEMREAMANATVGDDVYGEDPTVNQLENETAELLGKEAGLFVSSGTQGNLISILTHCGRGDEIIVGDKAHTFMYEAGGISALGGVHPHTIPVQQDGTLLLDDIRRAIRGDNYHFPPTRLITLENTQGTVGGIPVSKEYSDKVAEIARENNLILHIDGARIFNAAAAYNISAKELIETADSMTFCLSKGLCAPVGSLIVGTKDFIARARRTRKILGGGMRQAGILAAAGLISIHKMANRLHEDHANAQLIGQGLKTVPHLTIKSINANFVFIELHKDAPLSPQELFEKLDKEYNIVLGLYPNYTHVFRAVTHYWITEERARKFTEAMRTLLS